MFRHKVDGDVVKLTRAAMLYYAFMVDVRKMNKVGVIKPVVSLN